MLRAMRQHHALTKRHIQLLCEQADRLEQIVALEERADAWRRQANEVIETTQCIAECSSAEGNRLAEQERECLKAADECQEAASRLDAIVQKAQAQLDEHCARVDRRRGVVMPLVLKGLTLGASRSVTRMPRHHARPALRRRQPRARMPRTIARVAGTSATTGDPDPEPEPPESQRHRGSEVAKRTERLVIAGVLRCALTRVAALDGYERAPTAPSRTGRIGPKAESLLFVRHLIGVNKVTHTDLPALGWPRRLAAPGATVRSEAVACCRAPALYTRRRPELVAVRALSRRCGSADPERQSTGACSTVGASRLSCVDLWRRPMSGRIDADAVRAVLTGEKVLDFYAQVTRGTRTLSLRECPRCKRRQRRIACKVDRDTGRWIHHSGPGGAAVCKGDVLDLVAAFEGLDARTHFRDVLTRAAQIAGIAPDADPAELARVRAAHQAERQARDRRAADERARGEAMVPALWEALDRRHLRGERYLAERGLGLGGLRQRGDVVRFYPDGEPAVRLYDLATSAPINIIRRQIDCEPKILALDLGDELGADDVVGTFSTSGTLAGRVADIDPDGVDIAVLVEGMTDSLAALLAFPTCAVLGANGWYMMPRVAAAIAPRLVTARGWLLVAVDDDEQGVAGAGEAMRAAVGAGLVLEESVRAIELGDHHDLADAWRAGWRWQWPDLVRGPGGAA
jgi:hypothetical protein